MNLSDSTEHKFIESFDVSDWEVETDTGWQEISATNKTIEYQIYKITLESGRTLECADTHILFDQDMNEIYAIDTLGTKIQTCDGPELVVSIKTDGEFENMYDLSVDSRDHRYYTDGFLSHNTTVMAAYFCHYIIFNDSKTCAILANKASLAREILSRTKLAYEHLPKWLQHGIVEWNKGRIELENGSRIIASATSGAAIRGETINCVGGDTKICVADNGNIFYINIDDYKDEFIEDNIKEKIHLFYRTRNIINGKIYYGIHSTTDINDGYLGSGTLILRAIEMYGPENFEIEHQICESREQASSLEKMFVDKDFVERDDNYNIVTGGENSRVYYGESNGFFGKKHTQETQRKIVDTRIKNSASGKIEPPPLISINLKTGEVYPLFSDILRSFDYEKNKSEIDYPESSKKRRFVESLCHFGEIEFINKKLNDTRVENYKKYLDWVEGSPERKIQHARETSKRFSGKKFSPKRCSEISAYVSNYIRNNREEFLSRMLRINTDPEKIRKTAEAHTGMKRSEENKKNMSNSAKLRVARDGVHNAGTLSFYDPITIECVVFKPGEQVPMGWIKGTGKFCCCNSESKVLILKIGDDIPTGFILGRKWKS
jgi:hypothetical protein